MGIVTMMAKEHESNKASDAALLRAFVASGSEEAFATLVKKYLGMVLGIAARRTGDHALAEEIAQNVFTILARKATRLKSDSTLAAWIHRVTVIECAESMRRECSRRTKMNAVSRHLLAEADGREVWREALPLLDEGIDTLDRADREVILLRFFERKSFREIGAALGKSDDAAQKRTERALRKLSDLLKRKGVVVSAMALGAGLANQVAHGAAPALANSIAQSAIAAAPSFGAKILILKTIKAMTYAKTKTAVIVTVVLAVPIAMQWQQNHQLREALNTAQMQRDAFAEIANARAGSPEDGGLPSRRESSFASHPGASRFGSQSDASVSDVSPNSDPASAAQEWERALFSPDPLQRAQRISQLLATLTADNAPAVAQAFERAKKAGLNFADELRLFVRAWGRLGGAAAVEFAISYGGQESNEAVAALGGWASVSPVAVQTWIDALPDGRAKETLIYGLLDGWSMLDFQAAAAYAESRPGSTARDNFRELLLQRALQTGGIEAAQTWVHRIPENEANRDYKQRAFSDVIHAMLYRDPAAAARWISELNGQPFIGVPAVTETAKKLAETSPLEALSWLGSLDAAVGAPSVAKDAGKIFAGWAQQDNYAAGAWLAQNTNHPTYDRMTESYVRTIIDTAPDTAAQWAQTIRDDVIRTRAITGADPAPVAALSGSGYYSDAVETYFQALKVKSLSEKLALSKNPHGSGTQWKNCAACHSW